MAGRLGGRAVRSIRASIEVLADVNEALASWSALATPGHVRHVEFEPIGRGGSRVTVQLACRPTTSARHELERHLIAFRSEVERRDPGPRGELDGRG
jgi:hypothetical protein